QDTLDVRRPRAVRLGDLVSPRERVAEGDDPRYARAAVHALVGRAEPEDVRPREVIVTLLPRRQLFRSPEAGRNGIRDPQVELGRGEEQEDDRAEQRAPDQRPAQQPLALERYGEESRGGGNGEQQESRPESAQVDRQPPEAEMELDADPNATISQQPPYG